MCASRVAQPKNQTQEAREISPGTPGTNEMERNEITGPDIRLL